MCFDECIGRLGVVLAMKLGRIATAIGAGDGVNCAVRLAGRDAARGDFNGRALADPVTGIAVADMDVMNLPIDTIDQQVTAIAMFVSEAATDDPSDNGSSRMQVVSDGESLGALEATRA